MGSYVKAANKKKKASYAEVAVNNYGRIENNNYDEYEKNKKAYDLAMRIAAEDAAFSSDAQKVGNISKAYGGVYTGSQDPMHIMLGNHMGAFVSSGVKGAADRAYDRIIKDAGQMAENGEIHKEDAEKIIRKAKYNRYYSDRYPEAVKKAGKEQAEYIKDLGISNKEYPWYVKYKDLSSGGLKAAAEAAERARNGEKTVKAGSKEIDITKMADATDDEIEWLKNRSAAVLERERYERYGKMDYHALKEAAAHTWDPEEKEWILSYAESTKKPEDYDTEIYEKWKTLKDLEDRYGYDEVSGRFKEDGSSLTTEGHKTRNAMLGEIISAKEDLARTQRQKDKRAGDLRKEEYYNSLKNNTDYGIYAGRNLPASSYAADIDADQMTPYEAAGLDSRYDMDGKEEYTPVVAGNELVMSDEEKKNYNYLYHTQGEQAAKDYLSFIQEDLNRRRAEVTAGNVKGYGNALLYSLGSGWNRGLPDAMSKLSNLFGGEEAVPVTEDEYVNSILSERYKDAGPKLFGRSIGRMGLETAENIGNMAPSMIASSAIGGPAGPVVGAAMMGISAGANTANEAWRDGNDRSRSIAYGVVNGMLEGGLQYALGGIASFGGAVSGLTKNALKNKIGGTLGKALMNLGISGLSEGTEEYLQEVLDPIVRNQLLGEKNEMKFITDDALYSGLQGALTSWILGGVGDISTAVNETSLTRLGKEMRSYEDAYIDAAGQYGLTDSIEEYNESEKTDMDLGKLISDVLAETRRNNEEQFVSGIGKNHADRMGSVREAAEKMGLNALIGKYDESEKTDHDTGEFILGVQEAIGSDIINAKSMDKAEAAYAKATKDAPEYVTEVADKAFGERLGAEIRSTKTLEEAQELYNGRVTEDTPDVIRQAADDAIAVREMEDAREKANKAFGVDRMSENTQNVKREMAKSTNADQEHFSDGFNYYYAYGRSGESFERAVNADENTGKGAWNLTESEKRLAWEQGRQDLEAAYENKTPGSRAEGTVRNMKADEISDANRAKGIRAVREGEVNKDIQTAVMGLSVFNGVNTVLYASDEVTDETGRNIGKTAPNGWYDSNTNTIYIDVTAENAGKNAVMMVYAHEFTHSLQENAPKEYKALRGYIIKTFENSGKTLDGLIENQLELANRNGVELTREKAVDEVIADACQELFKNSKAIDDLAQNNPKVFNKLRDFIKKAIASIRKVLKRSETTSEEAVVLRGILGDLTEAQRLYDDTVKTAATRETVESKNSTTTEEAEVDKESDNVVYSFDNGIKLNDNEEKRYRILKNLKVRVAKMDSAYSNEIIAKLEEKGFDTKKLDKPLSVLDNSDEKTIFDVLCNYKELKIGRINYQFSTKSLREGMKNVNRNKLTVREYIKMLSMGEEIVKNATQVMIHEDAYKDTPNEKKDLEKTHVLLGGYIDEDYFCPIRVVAFQRKKNINNNIYFMAPMNRIKTSDLLLSSVKANQGPSVSLHEGTDYGNNNISEVYKASIAEIISKINTDHGNFLNRVPKKMLGAEQIDSAEQSRTFFKAKRILLKENKKPTTRQVKEYIKNNPVINETLPFSLRNIAPTTDTKGRKLSAGQSSFFKDSAVRDENGNLIVMYHGTPYGGFTVFRNGLTYFTPNKEYADRYHNPSASSVRGRYDPATNEQTYEVYLNITKPFDIRNAEDRKIFIDEYVKGGYAAGINPYLSRSEIEKQIAGGIDWMEADNLYEFIMDNEYDYDGLVLNEGADGGYGDEVTQRGLSYVTFSPEQAKNVDNTNPTKSKDLRFNLRAPVEKSRDLVAYHNISVEKLAKALNLGGLVAPSFAVTKRGMKHTGFGGITLIAPRDLIDPEVNSNASLFTRDAWTPTVPNTVIKLDDKAAESAAKRLGMSEAFLKSNLEGVRTEKDAVERLKDFIQAKRAFVKEKGYEVEPVLHDAKTDYLDVKELQDYIREENITAGRIMNDENVRKNILKTVEDSFENKTGKTAKFIKNAKIRRLNELFERLANTSLSEKYFDKISEEIEVINGKTGKVMTENSYEEGLDNLIKEKSDEYEAFISDAVFGMIESEWIEKSGVEPYYQDGTRKSWNQLYRPLTLDNLVLEMKNQPEQGAGGYANIKGMAAEKMSSVEEARARKNQIKELSSEELKEINHKIFEKTKAITDKIMNESEFASMFDVEEDIVESLQTNDTRDEVYRDLVRFYPKLTPAIVDEIYDLIDYMRSQPVSYFEAKVMDAVGIEQFEAAVVPGNLPQEMKDALREKGLDVTEYDPESEENRVEATNEAAEDYQFSFRKPNSPRRILADALDSAAQTDEEKRLLKEYKSSITATETLEFLVGEMKKAAETAETAEERDMYLRKAGWYSDAVRVNDKKLLEMEATEPLKNVMEREAEARKKEGAEGIMKRYAARDERRRMREIRDRSKTEIANLTRMITKPNKKDYVPDVLKKTVGDFIQSIDFVSKYADPNSWNTEQWRSKMYNLAAVLRNNAVDGNETGQGDTAIGMDPTMFDPDLLRQIDAFIKNHEGKNISDLDSAGLADLYIITRKLRMGIRNYNRMFTNKRFESIERAGYETIEMLDEKKTRSRKRDIGIISVLDKLFNVDMLEPKSYFKRFGKAGESIYEAIAEGDDRNKSVLQDASEYVAGVYKRLGIDAKTVRKWGGRKAKQSFDIRGNNITLTPLQIMTLYELSKREQAMRHINRGGIIVQGEDVISVNEKDPSGKQTNEGEKAVTLFDDDLKMITDTLTDEQKAFADELQKWMANEGAAYGNEVSMKMYGSKNFTEQNYFPIKTDSNSRNASTNEDSGNTNLYRILNLGMTKTVDETARNAVIITDIMSAFSEHVADMASYYGYAMPIADAMKWFNYRYDIGHATKSVRTEMDRVFGKETQQYFKTLLADINGNTALNNDNLFDALIGHYKAAAVGGNVRVVIQQPIAYIRALNVMNPKYLAKAFGSKRNFEEMKKYAPIAWWKDSSFRENGMGKSLKSTLTNDMTLTERWTDFLTKPAGIADKLTWGRLWNAVKYEVKDQYGDMEYEDYMKKCAKRFRQIVDESQVVDTKLSRSQLMRNQNGLTKLATAFMMEPTKTYNMLYDAYTSKDAKKIARATAVWALENIVLIAVKSAYDSFRRLNWSDDEKEKDYLQRFLDSAKTNAADEFIPLNMIPFLKEIPGAFEAIFSDNDNTRAQRFDMQWLYDLTDAVKKNKKFYSGDYNEKDMWKAQESILKLLSNVSGVPISNLYREAKTIKNSVQYQFMGQETINEQIRRAAQYKYDGEFDKYKEERKKILEERYVLGNKKITSDEFVKMVDSEYAKIKKEAAGENAEEDKDEFEQDKAMYKIGDAKKAVSDGNYRYVQEILDEIYDAGHPVTEEQKADYFESKAKSFKSSLGKLLYKDPEDKDGDGKISDEEKADKVLADDYEKKKKEYLKLKIDGKPLFDEDYFLDREKKDRKNGFDAALEAAGKSADTGASAQSIQKMINEMYDAEKPDSKKEEVDYKSKKKSSIKSSLTTYYKSQHANVRARLKVIYKKLYISGSKIPLYDSKSFVTMEKDIKEKAKAEKNAG